MNMISKHFADKIKLALALLKMSLKKKKWLKGDTQSEQATFGFAKKKCSLCYIVIYEYVKCT